VGRSSATPVSRLVIDRTSLAVKDATYVLDGSEQYVRLCSATWVGAAEGSRRASS